MLQQSELVRGRKGGREEEPLNAVVRKLASSFKPGHNSPLLLSPPHPLHYLPLLQGDESPGEGPLLHLQAAVQVQ
jgi:hypothetical protein